MAFDATARAHDNVSILDPFANDARECFRQQAATIAALASRVDRSFGQAVRLLHATQGHVVVTGIGKSGHVGRKLAATFASTGTPSFFVHAAEAFHGDAISRLCAGDPALPASGLEGLVVVTDAAGATR